SRSEFSWPGLEAGAKAFAVRCHNPSVSEIAAPWRFTVKAHIDSSTGTRVDLRAAVPLYQNVPGGRTSAVMQTNRVQRHFLLVRNRKFLERAKPNYLLTVALGQVPAAPARLPAPACSNLRSASY